MDYDRLINNWHAKASEEDYFSKFVFEYLAFVAILRKKKFTEAINDRRAIQLLKQDEELKKAYLIKKQGSDDIKTSWTNITNELNRIRLGNVSDNGDEVKEIKWWNCSHLELQDQTEEEKEKVKGVIHSEEDWESIVEFWHSIRNNLFHASKDPNDERDIILVENGYKTLSPLVEIFLSQ